MQVCRRDRIVLSDIQLDRDAVAEQLDRIVSSTDFTAGPRARKFLAHLVAEELEGRGELLKGTALAMDVFGRDASFDPNSDPIVRIEAVKLRKALEHYYLTSGAGDEIIISVPKGHYRPKFEYRPLVQTGPQRAPRSGLPRLAILSFTGDDRERARLYREGLPEEIALELARFGQLSVISGWHEDAISASRSAVDLAARTDYVLRGNVREAGGSLRVSVQLSRLPDEALIWSDRLRIDADHADVFGLQEEIARQCATRLADAYGIVAEDLSAQYSGRKGTDAGVYEALLAFHAHMRTARLSSLNEFQELAQSALQDNPSSGLAHALVAIALIEAATLGSASVEDVVEKGRIHAEKAIALAPNCQEALFAAAAFAQARGDAARYRNLISRAIDANPNATLMMALVGGWLAKSGDVDSGLELVRAARERNPLLPIWVSISLAVEPLIAGDFRTASDLVRDIDARDSIYDWLLIAVAHALAGEQDLAHAAIAPFNERGIQPEDYVSTIRMDARLRERITAGLERIAAI